MSKAVQYRVIDHTNDREQTATTRKDAERKADTARNFFDSENVEIVEEQTGDTTEVVEDAEPLADAEPVDAELSPRDVTDDPISWLEHNGEHFVDYVGRNSTPAINRKGFEVLSHFYEIDVHTELQVGPEETDFTFCRAKATATTPEGRECQAFGSAHVDRGDDAELLLEMADTRARKRALSIATGVGAVAVEEMTGASQ